MHRFKLASYLFASVALASFTAACEDPDQQLPPPKPDQAIYATYEQCLIDNPADLCRKALDATKLAQSGSAPHYSIQAQCEAEYGVGHCNSGSDGSFYPMMMGFMLGSALNSGPRYYPVYYSTHGAVYTGRTVITTLPPAQVSTVMRGGFGAQPLHVTPNASSGVPLRTPQSYGSYRSGTGVYSSYGAARSSSSSAGRSSFGGSTARGGFGASAGAHGGFGGG